MQKKVNSIFLNGFIYIFNPEQLYFWVIWKVLILLRLKLCVLDVEMLSEITLIYIPQLILFKFEKQILVGTMYIPRGEGVDTRINLRGGINYCVEIM